MGTQFCKKGMMLDLSNIFYESPIENGLGRSSDQTKFLEIEYNKVVVEDIFIYEIPIDLDELSEELIKDDRYKSIFYKHIKLFDLTVKHKLKRD